MAVAQGLGGPLPSLAIDDGPLIGPMRLIPPSSAGQFRECWHGAASYPSNFETCWNQLTSSGGRKSPAAKTNARCTRSGA